ncbi:MAG: peptidylprolyl isomerase [Candidatus Zixiibacteriota bacterium]|nr:MAG: peptidylprolyl isomerase [candidate division Zixibacteria bacterium]
MDVRKMLAVAAAAVLASVPATAERDVADKIVAVVGDQVIVASELANQIQLLALQSRAQLKTEEEIKRFQQNVLDEMVSDRLFLLAAREDTSISVREEEIEAALDEQVTRVAGNYGSYDEFLDALAAEALTVRELKKRWRPEIENQLLKQRYIQKKLYSVSVSRREVTEFYEKFRDSIPTQPEAVKLAHILLTIQPSPRVEDSVRQYVEALRQRIVDGADFAVISSEYSTDGAGVNGGDLGYLSRDDVVPEFARAAFNLSVGDISGVIRTQFGYHVIKCEGKREDRLKLRHLLVSVPPLAEDTARTLLLVDSLKRVASSGEEDFAQLAKAFSSDDNTRAHGGELGWFAVEQMPVEFADAVRNWTAVGELKGPVTSNFGFHILKLLDYQAQKQYTLEDDYDRIKELARQDKTGRLVDEWIEELKKETFISYRLE